VAATYSLDAMALVRSPPRHFLRGTGPHTGLDAGSSRTALVTVRINSRSAVADPRRFDAIFCRNVISPTIRRSECSMPGGHPEGRLPGAQALESVLASSATSSISADHLPADDGGHDCRHSHCRRFEDVRAMVRRLEVDRHRVREAPDAKAALEALDDAPADLVITDINMPDIDGLTLVRALRQRPRERFIPILVLTTESDEAIKQRGREAGATGWLVKPFEPGRLREVVLRVLPRSAR
jgi:two-component system chemotaxis response regulator CheY